MEIIFDFDGTLVDSFDCVIAKFNQLSEKFEFRKIQDDDINHIRDMDTLSLLKYLHMPLLKIPSIIKQIQLALRDEISHLKPVTGLTSVLRTLHANGKTLGIVTSNSHTNVELWLKQHRLQHFFSYIYTESSLVGKGSLLKNIIKSHHLEQAKTFYIGDETRDIVAAKQNDINAVAVTWGYNSETALRKYDPHFVAYHPDDLLAITVGN